MPMGPSPWAFRNCKFKCNGLTFYFREAALEDSKLAGLTSLQDAEGATLLIFDFQCYGRILDNGTALFWRETRDKSPKRIIFDSFALGSLQRLTDPRATAVQLRDNKLGIAPLSHSEHWEFAPYLSPGLHSFPLTHDWSHFEETLVLGDHQESDGYNNMSRAIFSFDWRNGQVEVSPQDWFNNGNYDFGYQWITRVARQAGGGIVGDGIRLGRFELDSTNRQVKTWITSDPFYRLPQSQ